MSMEELVAYLDAMAVVQLNFYKIHDNSNISFDHSIVKIGNEFIVRFGNQVFNFDDVQTAAACFIQRLGIAA